MHGVICQTEDAMRTTPDRPVRITLRLSDAEFGILVDLATANEVTVSDMARKILTEGTRARNGHPHTPRKGRAT
jgi:hypothetical protein